MKELDAMLTTYLDQGLTAQELADFERLLQQSDDQLWAWFMGRSAPDDEAMDGLVRHIRQVRPAS